MAWKFRKRIKIIPGIHLNISKSGISTTIGIRGASINIRPNGTYLNTSIPGLGMHSRRKISGNTNLPSPEIPAAETHFLPEDPDQASVKIAGLTDNIFSVDANEVTSQDMQGIKDTILLAHQQRKELSADRLMVLDQWKKHERRLNLSYWLIYGFIFKERTLTLKQDIEEQRKTLVAIDYQLKENKVQLDFDFDEEMKAQYERLFQSFEQLCNAEKIWDITSSHANDQFTTRSSAAYSVVRREVKFKIAELPEINSKIPALMWQNANGADLYFYPNFMVVWNNKHHFAIVGYNELDISYSTTRFIEEDRVPKDTVVVDQTWYKVNKNGQPDKRFKDNYRIPVVAYGNLEMRTATGLNERYLFSSDANTAIFNREFLEYRRKLIKLDYLPEVTVL